jgi:uncharacterized cupredoxin-like copper-binding protein
MDAKAFDPDPTLFSKAGEFFYGCLIPGHFEAGMAGTIVVAD